MIIIYVYYLQKSTVDFSQSLLDEMESMFRSFDGHRHEDTVNIALSLFTCTSTYLVESNISFKKIIWTYDT